MATKPVDKQSAAVYLKRFKEYSDVIRFLEDEPEKYGDTLALLAVHSAISLGDAILVACTGRRSIDQDHRESLRLLRDLCHARRVPDDGLKQYDRLIERKTDISYGERWLYIEGVVKRARLQAVRFAFWAQKNFRKELDQWQ